MKTAFSRVLLGAALLLAGSAHAGLTNIAQVPLLNITGTGTVKPNLMLLFDNSGSMAYTATPEYIRNERQCRSGLLPWSGTLSVCSPGHPPFMSPDFNKQYYNPTIRYQPPVNADGTFYPEKNSGNTDGWKNVTSDGFGKMMSNLFESSSSSINLLGGFPDLEWCSSSGDCKTNTATYQYPDDVYNDPSRINTAPYYYTIGIAEYCTDASLVECRSVAPGGSAPAGYPVAAMIRWCDANTLLKCQAKRTGNFTFPRFSMPTSSIQVYGTISIGASATASALTITSATIPDPYTARTITNASVNAPAGTDTAAKRQALATALAASIIAKTGLGNQYIACVRTPSNGTAPACSTYGIQMADDNVVAVIPVTCSATKSLANCTPITDTSRSGWGITVNAPRLSPGVNTTALINISGTTRNAGTPDINGLEWNGVTLLSELNLGKDKNARSAAATMVAKINDNNKPGIDAYVGGNAITPVCAAKTNTSVCLVDSNATSNVGNLLIGSIDDAGSMTMAGVDGAGYLAPGDAIPVETTAISRSSAAASTFRRVDIVPTRTSYPKAAERTDCAGASCTYDEEMTNFANWYAYYKTRMQMMKTSVGLAFAPINANYRVGLAKLSDADAGNDMAQTPAAFEGSSRISWYNLLYGITTTGSTPLRSAMHAIGKMFANKEPYAYEGDARVVQFPCQQNFMIVTTDGYWNGDSAAGVLNNDNVENASRFCTAARGCVDKASTGTSLADVALYWYNGGSNTETVSLRTDLDSDMNKLGQVPAGTGENTHLHVNTYTLGLGMDGVMNYDLNYQTAKSGDFYNLVTGATQGCPWNNNGAWVWPNPKTASTSSTVQERVDDLWHAAVNGHGKYFSASQPRDVIDGLSSALSGIQVKLGAAAAAATSTPNISIEDNDIFASTFTTVKWFGELSKKKVDIQTGQVASTAVWSTSKVLGTMVGPSSDSRMIYFRNSAGALKQFEEANLTDELAWFTNKCAALAQCNLMSSANKLIANNPTHLINWLRGRQQYANNTVFRAYSSSSETVDPPTVPIPVVLGDIASSKPAYLRDSRMAYTTAGYNEFKVDNADRAAVVFAAANDGMLHAFSAATGTELWAYMPRISMAKLHRQASTGYGTNHQYTTDGSPELGEVQINGVWKTVLVAGMNGGGRGYYALDVTNPTMPVPLWERCADAAICPAVAGDDGSTNNFGLTFGNPQFGMWRGSWVVYVTSGYNNVAGVDGVASGDGKGYLYILDIATGRVRKRVSTGSGSPDAPSGLAKITSISKNPFTDPVTTYIYGGDNLGQMWRFDLTDTASDNVGVHMMGSSGAAQPITTRPEVTLCAATETIDGTESPHAQRVVLFGTGRLLDVPDMSDTAVQSMYMIRDKDEAATVAVRGATMVKQTLSTAGSSGNANTYTITSHPVDLATKDGWYFDWSLNDGERMNLDPQVFSGSLVAVTNVPAASSACSVGGSSNMYQINACTGSFVSSDGIAGSTLSATSAAVGFIVISLPTGAQKVITTLANGENLTTDKKPPPGAAARKVGWRRLKN